MMPIYPPRPPAPPTPQPTIITRYGVDFCVFCSLMVDYCRCGTTPAEEANDGSESGLSRRIAECMTK